MKTKQTKPAKIMFVIMIIMFVGKALGLYRNRMVGSIFGTDTMEAQAYAAMSLIPRTFLDATFAAAISASFIPIFNRYLKLNKHTAFKLADTFITLILAASLAFTLLGALFAPQILSAIYSGFDYYTHALTVPVLRITVFTIVLSGAAFAFVGVLQSLGGFYAPAAMSAISNGIIIAYLFFFMERFGITGLAVVFLIGWGAQVLIQIPPLIKRGYIYRPRLNFKDSGLKEIGALALPVMVSSWVIPINILVNQSAASIIYGGAAVIDHAYNLYAVISGLFVLAIANVIFPKLSREADDSTAFTATLRKTTLGMLFFLVPIMFGLLLLSAPLVEFLLQTGYFDEHSTYLVSGVLRFYALGIPGFGLFTILSRGFYAAKNGRVPLITAIIAITINLILSFVFAQTIGINGVALASAISINITGLIMLIVMSRRQKGLVTATAIFEVIRMFIAGAIMAVAVHFVQQYFSGHGVLATLLISTVSGVAAYFFTAFILRCLPT